MHAAWALHANQGVTVWMCGQVPEIGIWTRIAPPFGRIRVDGIRTCGDKRLEKTPPERDISSLGAMGTRTWCILSRVVRVARAPFS